MNNKIIFLINSLRTFWLELVETSIQKLLLFIICNLLNELDILGRSYVNFSL